MSWESKSTPLQCQPPLQEIAGLIKGSWCWGGGWHWGGVGPLDSHDDRSHHLLTGSPTPSHRLTGTCNRQRRRLLWWGCCDLMGIFLSWPWQAWARGSFYRIPEHSNWTTPRTSKFFIFADDMIRWDCFSRVVGKHTSVRSEILCSSDYTRANAVCYPFQGFYIDLVCSQWIGSILLNCTDGTLDVGGVKKSDADTSRCLVGWNGSPETDSPLEKDLTTFRTWEIPLYCLWKTSAKRLGCIKPC